MTKGAFPASILFREDTAIGAVALVLLIVGAALLVLYRRSMRTAIQYRINLVRSLPENAASILPRKAEENLTKHDIGGLTQTEAAEVARWLTVFGVPLSQAAAVFVSVRLLISALAAIVAIELSFLFAGGKDSLLVSAGATAMGGILGWFGLLIFIRRKASQRSASVEAGLPDAIELLVICVEAGLSLEEGFERVAAELRNVQPVIAEELAVTSADLKVLPSRDMALANMADRVGRPSMRSIATTLSQTMRYGTPLVQALRTVSAELRNDQLIAIEEKAARMPVLLTIPMIVFIMPCIFLIIGGPAALGVIDAMTHR